jgi:hypothetical protein
MSQITIVQCFGVTSKLRRCTRPCSSLGDPGQGIFCYQHSHQAACDGLLGPSDRDRATEGVAPTRRCRYGPACETCALLWAACPVPVIIQAPQLVERPREFLGALGKCSKSLMGRVIEGCPLRILNRIRASVALS